MKSSNSKKHHNIDISSKDNIIGGVEKSSKNVNDTIQKINIPDDTKEKILEKSNLIEVQLKPQYNYYKKYYSSESSHINDDLYVLDLYIHNVAILEEAELDEKEKTYEYVVGMRLFEYPTIFIHPRSYNEKNRQLRFYNGKSCFFKLSRKELIKMIKLHPLYVFLFRIEKKPILVGTANISLDDIRPPKDKVHEEVKQRKNFKSGTYSFHSLVGKLISTFDADIRLRKVEEPHLEKKLNETITHKHNIIESSTFIKEPESSTINDIFKNFRNKYDETKKLKNLLDGKCGEMIQKAKLIQLLLKKKNISSLTEPLKEKKKVKKKKKKKKIRKKKKRIRTMDEEFFFRHLKFNSPYKYKEIVKPRKNFIKKNKVFKKRKKKQWGKPKNIKKIKRNTLGLRTIEKNKIHEDTFIVKPVEKIKIIKKSKTLNPRKNKIKKVSKKNYTAKNFSKKVNKKDTISSMEESFDFDEEDFDEEENVKKKDEEEINIEESKKSKKGSKTEESFDFDEEDIDFDEEEKKQEEVKKTEEDDILDNILESETF